MYFNLIVLGLLLVAPACGLGADPIFGTQNRVGFPAGDDWEPAMAADQYGHLYVVYYHTDVKGQSSCNGCNLHLLFQQSSDGGNTWSSPILIAPGPVNGGQFDPWLVVDPADGRTLWVSFMQGFPQAQIALVMSTNFGVSWSTPAIVSGSLNKLDKDVLAVAGGTMAAFFDDYNTLYASISTNRGSSWTLHSLFTYRSSPRQFLCSGAGIDSAGNVFSAWNVYDASSAGVPCKLWLEKSSDGGQTWVEQDIDVGGDPYPCSQCGAGAYLAPQIALRVGGDDTIYLLWNTTTNVSSGTPERIYFSKSTDHGQTFSPRQELSSAPAGTEHCFPSLFAGAATGDVRVAWMDTRTGLWNVFYRVSTNGGASFSSEIRLSGFVPGYSYLTAQGFQFPYGDYFQIAADCCGATHVAFGETSAYTAPGNIWVANEQAGWHLGISFQPGQVKLSWPAAFARAKLEHSTNPSGDWMLDETAAGMENNQWVVVEAAAGWSTRYFRLRCP